MRLAMLAAFLALPACTTQQALHAGMVTVDAAVCVIAHKNEPPAQVALTCGLAAVEDATRLCDAAKADAGTP